MGICGLCNKDSILKDSHLMPKSIYKAIRNSYSEGGVVVGKKFNNSIGYTDHQIKKHLLCDSCESRFSEYGENAVTPECYRREGKFKLLTKLDNLEPIKEIQDEQWFKPNDYINSNHYLYFALSIIWRAAKGGKWGDGMDYSKSLGNKYEHEIQRYLLGKSTPPPNVYVAVYVDSDIDIVPIMSFPTVKKMKGYHHHIFYIPGIKFSVIIGGHVPRGIVEMYSKTNTNIFFVRYSFRNHKDFSFFHKEVKCVLQAKGRLNHEQES